LRAEGEQDVGDINREREAVRVKWLAYITSLELTIPFLFDMKPFLCMMSPAAYRDVEEGVAWKVEGCLAGIPLLVDSSMCGVLLL
jgi:hypothetical protein